MQHNDNAAPNEEEHMREQDDNTGSNGNGNQRQGSNSEIGYRIVGVIAIIFGIIVGLFLFTALMEMDRPTLFTPSKSEATFGAIAIALGASLLFVVPGVICLGVGRIINLLESR